MSWYDQNDLQSVFPSNISMAALLAIAALLLGQTEHKRPVLVLSVAAMALLLLGGLLYDHALACDSMICFVCRISFPFPLQHLGVQTWLDVQRLAPGTDWQQGLRDGLASPTGLVPRD